MSYQCEQCQESSTVGDALNTMLKVGAVVALGYLVLTFKDQLKDIVGKALTKGQKHLSGNPRRAKRKKGPSKKDLGMDSLMAA